MVVKTAVSTKTEPVITDEYLIALSKGQVHSSELNVTNYREIAPSIPVLSADELVGVPFLIMRATEHVGDFGPFKSIAVVFGDNKIGIVNNGSFGSGIYQQIQDMEENGVLWPVFVEKGLRKSEYVKTLPDGKEIPAKTYYLAN